MVSSGTNAFETPDYATASEFIESGHLSLAQPPDGGPYAQGLNGRYYNVHELVPILVGVPIALAARYLPVPTIPVEQRFSALLMLPAAACFATTIVLLARVGVTLGIPYRAAVIRLGALIIASQYLVYAGAFPDVSLAVPLLAACVVSWMRAESGVRAGWLVVGLVAGLTTAVKLNTGTIIPVLLLLSATSPGAQTLVERLRRVSAIGFGLAPGALLIAGWNYARTGGWLATPYPSENVTIDLASLGIGLFGTFASPGKGLLVYTPALLLVPLMFGKSGLARARRRLSLLVFGSFGLAALMISSTEAWPSGAGWGIRFYVPWIPLMLLLLAGEMWRRRTDKGVQLALAGLMTIGLVINVAGAITNFHYRQQACGLNPWALRGAHTCALEAMPGNVGRTVGLSIPDVVLQGASATNTFASNRVALWWYSIQAVGVPAPVSWSIPVLLLAAAVVLWRRAGSPRALTA